MLRARYLPFPWLSFVAYIPCILKVWERRNRLMLYKRFWSWAWEGCVLYSLVVLQRIVGSNGQGVAWELKVHCKAALHVFVDLQMATKGHGTQRSINLSQTGTMALHETDLRLKSWSWSFKPPKSYHYFMFIIWSSLLFRTLVYFFIAYILLIHNRFKVLPKRQGIIHKGDPLQKFIFFLFQKL